MKFILYFLVSLSLINTANGIGFKLKCKFSELEDIDLKRKINFLDTSNQTHEFIGRDVKFIEANIYGETKQNDHRKIRWQVVHEGVQLKYVVFLKNNKSNLEIKTKDKNYDFWGTCFLERLELEENKKLEAKINY